MQHLRRRFVQHRIATALEWRLVTVSGVVESVSRDGAAWRAELTIGGGSIPIAGLERSGIASTALIEGRSASVTGIVKRAYPTATDQRFAVVPRSLADITLGAPGASASSGSGAPGTSPGPAHRRAAVTAGHGRRRSEC